MRDGFSLHLGPIWSPFHKTVFSRISNPSEISLCDDVKNYQRIATFSHGLTA